jgi:hypothetical protein
VPFTPGREVPFPTARGAHNAHYQYRVLTMTSGAQQLLSVCSSGPLQNDISRSRRAEHRRAYAKNMMRKSCIFRDSEKQDKKWRRRCFYGCTPEDGHRTSFKITGKNRNIGVKIEWAKKGMKMEYRVGPLVARRPRTLAVWTRRRLFLRDFTLAAVNLLNNVVRWQSVHRCANRLQRPRACYQQKTQCAPSKL